MTWTTVYLVQHKDNGYVAAVFSSLQRANLFIAQRGQPQDWGVIMRQVDFDTQ